MSEYYKKITKKVKNLIKTINEARYTKGLAPGHYYITLDFDNILIRYTKKEFQEITIENLTNNKTKVYAFSNITYKDELLLDMIKQELITKPTRILDENHLIIDKKPILEELLNNAITAINKNVFLKKETYANV